MLRSANVPAPGATQEAQVKMSRHAPFTLTVPVGPTDHVLGPDHAPVTIVEYGDLECPNCRQAAPAVRLLLSSFENKVRVAYPALSARRRAPACRARGRSRRMCR